ncbi:MAG: hypothetical protein J7619_07480 [Dyadobacter sp.]|uniref:hypothetical protein n=1 Tax=Dyadobacter sp. TaxID=1914288 RepID=UPI001B140F45|nr:hypothetical protein [Dyadobacter sp.]MBO9612518.1 hypothetical protein [Dyadobacter sp.]
MQTVATSIETLLGNAITKINTLPGANAKFYEQLGKSRTVVSNWRRGISKPSDNDLALFFKTAASIIREFEELQKKQKVLTQAAIAELESLISV